jgi:hypothetical protein
MKRYALILVTICSTIGYADVLTFDDVTTSQYTLIPNGYGGFDWDWFGVVHQSVYPGSGYENAVVSGEYAGFNVLGEVASLNGEVFDFNGVYLTAAWREGLNITVSGYLDGVLMYESTVTVDAYEPAWFDFNYMGIDSLVFESWGGTDIMPDSIYVGPHFAMDDFTFNEIIMMPVALDIMPGACPNKVNVKAKGKLNIAIAGSAELDVYAIDALSLEISGVLPVKGHYADVTTPAAGSCGCGLAEADGYDDLVLQFDRQAIIESLGNVKDGDEIILTLTGSLQDGTLIEGSDCVLIMKKGKSK